MCNEPNLTTVPDKFYKRKVNELKVRCPNKESGCGWVGDVGSVDQHATSCPRRPWTCRFCAFKCTYEVGTNNHLPLCVKYLEPCPNQCEIGNIPRCNVQKHLRRCPLQLVQCEFAKFGCQESVPRQDLAHHMEEGAQRHLRCMSLFNLSLTRELNQQMAEKDKKMTEKDCQIAILQVQLQQHEKQTGKQLEELNQKMFTYGQKIVILQTELERRDKQMKEQLEKCMKGWQDHVPKQQLHDETHLQVHQDLVVTAYSSKKRYPNVHPQGSTHYHYCVSDTFYCQQYEFQFNIDIFQNGDIRGYFRVLAGHNDDCLQWPIQCTVQLLILNQLGDHGHHLTVVKEQLRKVDRDGDWSPISYKETLACSADLQFNAARQTQYLKDDTLHFRLYLNVYK